MLVSSKKKNFFITTVHYHYFYLCFQTLTSVGVESTCVHPLPDVSTPSAATSANVDMVSTATEISVNVSRILLDGIAFANTVMPRYYAPRYYADSNIMRSVVDPDFLPPGESAKWACLNLLRIVLTILKKH